ncbi:MAG: MFS transporter, partial [Desulfitobacteriaceae bacterium]|nr:MFS transporter [Desulfitobacteriaceae bacterium]MDI6879127.1 MFS transporter [Desulfitobacteriaceae bacterium]
GKLSDRLGVKGPLVAGFFAAAICLALLPLQRAVFPTLVVGAFLGSSYSLILPAWNGLQAKVVSPEKRGTMWAIFMTIEGIGTATGAFIGGKVWEGFGHAAPFFVSAGVLAVMAVFYSFNNLQKLMKT